MNIKIKSTGVFCLVGDDYDKVFVVLRKQFGESNEQLFTERIPGHEYLQWELPGDGWIALSKGDPLMELEVRKELLHRRQHIFAQFGNNQEMAQKVLSVPSDDYIYYKPDNAGRLLIRLTAWGYRYPERVQGGSAGGVVEPEVPKEHVTISLTYGGEPLADKQLRLNGFLRASDKNGILEVGDLPVGYQFDVEVNSRKQHFTVTPGQGGIIIDLTEYATVEVRASLDNTPYTGAQVSLSYMGCNTQLTCDDKGHAVTRLPLDKDGSLCRVSIDDSIQQEVLKESVHVFVFQLTSPSPVSDKKKEDDTVKEKPEDEPKDELKNELKDEPKDESLGIITEPSLPDSVKEVTVNIKVMLDDAPYGGVKATLSYMDKQAELICDEKGAATIQLPLGKERSLCKVLVEDFIQQEPLKEGVNTFEFHLKSQTPPAPPVEDKPTKMPWWMYLLEALVGLLLIGLIYVTFEFCGGMLFG